MKCLYCPDPIEHRDVWRHTTDGTYLRTREEERTDWRGETAIAVLDDHYATPDYDS